MNTWMKGGDVPIEPIPVPLPEESLLPLGDGGVNAVKPCVCGGAAAFGKLRIKVTD